MKKRTSVDAVKLMRTARARLARRCRSMTYAEQRAYLDKQLAQEPPVPSRKKAKR